jgi:glycosyltransferase involved in cell wall biosynthesis
LPEIGGSAVLTCDPTNAQAMSALMARVVHDGEVRASLVAAGRVQLNAFSFEQSAQNLLAGLERVADRATEAKERARRTSWDAAVSPLVSIVTPSLNQGRFLRAAIESVLNQSYPRIELIVMDGGSTDDSLGVLRSYGDRIQWLSERDRGQAHALNKGFARARGEILGFLNADDVLAPVAVARAVAHLREHPACDLVYGRAQFIDAAGTVIGEYPSNEYSFPRLLWDNCICQPATFWRPRIARRIGPFDETLQYALDYEYWLRLDRAGGRIEHIPEVLAAWRMYPEIKSRRERAAHYREVFEVCLKHGGYVSLSWVTGLWHHRMWEKPGGWPRGLRRVPGALRVIARLDYYRRRLSNPGGPAWIVARARPVLQRLLGSVPLLRRALDGWSRRFRLVTPWAPIYGYWQDGWLGPVCQVLVRERRLGERLRIAGRPAADLTLEVRCANRVVGKRSLQGNVTETVTLDAESDGRGQTVVTLCFSAWVRDGAGRRVSFCVQETNLFSELETRQNAWM